MILYNNQNQLVKEEFNNPIDPEENKNEVDQEDETKNNKD